MMNPFLQVAIGGAIGSVARYGVYRALPLSQSGLPYATLTVNVVGSFVMGLLTALMALKWGNHYAPLMATGVMGGFTTFSAFSLDVMTLWERGHAAQAGLYILLSVVLSLLAIFAGLAIGREVFA